MMEPINVLLVAALKRSMRAVTSEELLDEAKGLADAGGWTPAELASLSRQSIAKRLAGMQKRHEVQLVGLTADARAGRSTPTWAPVDGYDPDAEIPDPPRRDCGPDPDAVTRDELLAWLDADNEIITTVVRFVRDLEDAKARARRRLADVGLESGT